MVHRYDRIQHAGPRPARGPSHVALACKQLPGDDTAHTGLCGPAGPWEGRHLNFKGPNWTAGFVHCCMGVCTCAVYARLTSHTQSGPRDPRTTTFLAGVTFLQSPVVLVLQHTAPQLLQPSRRSFLLFETEELLKTAGFFLIHEPSPFLFEFCSLPPHHGCFYCQDAASDGQQPGLPSRGQRGCQEGLPYGGYGLLLHHVLRCGENVPVGLL